MDRRGGGGRCRKGVGGKGVAVSFHLDAKDEKRDGPSINDGLGEICGVTGDVAQRPRSRFFDQPVRVSSGWRRECTRGQHREYVHRLYEEGGVDTWLGSEQVGDGELEVGG